MKTLEDIKKREEEIYEEIDCWVSLEDEANKLYFLFLHCATQEFEGQKYVHIEYVKGKVARLRQKFPIILSNFAKGRFIKDKVMMEFAAATQECSE